MGVPQALATPPKKALLLRLDVPVVGVYHDRSKIGDTLTRTTYITSGIGGGHVFSPLNDQRPMVPRVEIGVGGKLSNFLVMGATLQATFARGNFKENYNLEFNTNYEIKVYCLAALPFIEVLLIQNGGFIPFLLVTGGVRADIVKILPDDGSRKTKQYSIRGVAGLGGGIHIFIGKNASIDLTLTGQFEKGTMTDKNAGSLFISVNEYYRFDEKYDVMRISGDLTVGVSVWI